MIVFPKWNECIYTHIIGAKFGIVYDGNPLSSLVSRSGMVARSFQDLQVIGNRSPCRFFTQIMFYLTNYYVTKI